MKNIRVFLSENFQFLEVKFSIYLNRRVFVMILVNLVVRVHCRKNCSFLHYVTGFAGMVGWLHIEKSVTFGLID